MVEAADVGRLMNIGLLSFLSKYAFVYKELPEIDGIHFPFEGPAADLRHTHRLPTQLKFEQNKADLVEDSVRRLVLLCRPTTTLVQIGHQRPTPNAR
jgi:hypothetical protein